MLGNKRMREDNEFKDDGYKPSKRVQTVNNVSNLVEGLRAQDLAKVPISDKKIQEELNINMEALVDDAMKHFYNAHQQQGYKLCACSSCKKLLYPVLIKSYRNSEEYEFLHSKYLAMYDPMIAAPKSSFTK